MIAIAKEIYGAKNYKNMVLELNASDDRGIDVVRDKIKSFCSTQQLMNKGLKFVILDECDSMTNAAQFALRRIVEKYTRTTRFCLICNYVSKLIPALQSRCTRFRFGPLDDDSVMTKLGEVAVSENLTLEDGSGEAIVKLSGGDMRKVLNILESCSLAYKNIPVQKVFEVTGRPSREDVDSMFQGLASTSFNQSYQQILNLKLTKSLSVDDVVREIHKELMVTEMPDHQKMFLVNRLAEIEYRLAQGCNERAQIASLVGAFMEVRTMG
uniref:Replication factor C C-terminal domain-containing protein n=1 Tax=Strombidium inclinatum TaxID=197538 RepID=A0A7S3IF46_9SPIT|mmetsp:Transcript_15543/g.23842  ORF Transcript_15543/g.23842 Transcript_15543/m.23842 type:complete len:268 (+) Transcript_15543:199-1002(+)